MAVVVRLILGFAADMYEDEHNDIRHEVAKRVDGIGHHGRTMSHNARHKLEDEQQHIHCSPDKCHLIDFPVSFHRVKFTGCKNTPFIR